MKTNESLATITRAYLRGARIQAGGFENKWVDVATPPPRNTTFKWRIHHDDTLLRYGPISRKFYDLAENPPEKICPLLLECSTYLIMDVPLGTWLNYPRENELTKSLFLLLVAEELMEMGL